MKKAVSLFLAFICIFSLCSCSAKKQDEPSNTTDKTENSFTFTDDTGREITVKKGCRTASLLGSLADMWLLAGGEICAVADDAFEDLKLDLDKDTVNLGSVQRPDREKLFASNPEFVIASSKLSKHNQLRDSLDFAEIPSAYFNVENFDSYLRVLEIMTKINRTPENYEKYGIKQKTVIDEIIKRSKTKKQQKVLVMRASAASIRAKNSSGTMLGGMLKDLGCINIADSNKMLLENLSIESIIKENPDKIFFIQTGDDYEGIKKGIEKLFDENPLWKELDAVKSKNVFLMEKNLYNMKPNAKFSIAYEKLEKILYEK